MKSIVLVLCSLLAASKAASLLPIDSSSSSHINVQQSGQDYSYTIHENHGIPIVNNIPTILPQTLSIVKDTSQRTSEDIQQAESIPTPIIPHIINKEGQQVLPQNIGIGRGYNNIDGLINRHIQEQQQQQQLLKLRQIGQQRSHVRTVPLQDLGYNLYPGYGYLPGYDYQQYSLNYPYTIQYPYNLIRTI